MIEISCCELYTFYLEENQINISNQIVKMTGVKRKVLDNLLIKIFGMNSKSGSAFQSIPPVDFVKRFQQDNLVKLKVFFTFLLIIIKFFFYFIN